MTATGARVAAAAGHHAGTDGRWELLRALGALTLGPPAETARPFRALGLLPWTPAEHTDLFVLSLPPYASIHLGSEGKLGGEAADRVAGVWRTLGLAPPGNADHLGVILALYAELGQAAAQARSPGTRELLKHTRTAVLWEHLWPWVPGYLEAASAHAGSARPWARLTLRTLAREARKSSPAMVLPLALRTAPPQIQADISLDDLLDALTVRVRCGFLLTNRDLSFAADSLGLGLRLGERRFALKALLGQDPATTLRWLSDHAMTWSRYHLLHPAVAGADPGTWWAGRASQIASILRQLSRAAAGSGR
jgi:Nitrate reductase delta subunit